jgi:hypothetical protein
VNSSGLYFYQFIIFFYNFKNEGGIEEVLPWKEKSALAFGTLIPGYCLLHSSFVVRVE